MWIFSQILGVVALVIYCFSYVTPQKNNFLILQGVGNVFFASSFLVISSYVAGILGFVSIVRCFVFWLCEKHNVKNYFPLLLLFCSCYVVITCVFWQSAWDIVPRITCISFCVGSFVKSLLTMRIIFLLSNILLIVFCIIQTTYTSALTGVVEIVILLYAIIKKKNQTNLDNQIK